MSNKSRSKFLMLLHPLTNFEMQQYNLMLMEFIQKIIYLKKGWGTYKKS